MNRRGNSLGSPEAREIEFKNGRASIDPPTPNTKRRLEKSGLLIDGISRIR